MARLVNIDNAEKVNFKIIDWMRGLAALYVVFNHSRGKLFESAGYYSKYVPKATWGIWEWFNVIVLGQSNLGTEFVILFFILSGFSIAHSLSNGNGSAIQFYKRRFVRLYPPFLLGIAWAVVVFLLFRAFAPHLFYDKVQGMAPIATEYKLFTAPGALFENLLYYPVYSFFNPQYWSLPYEVLFYLMMPFLFKRLRLYTVITAGLLVAGLVIYQIGYFDTDQLHIVKAYLFDYNVYFFIGVLFYKYRSFFFRHYKVPKWAGLLILAILLEGVVQLKGYRFHNIDNKLTGLLMICFTYLLLFSSLKYNIRIKALERIGAFSYTLYLTHYATICLTGLVFYKMGNSFYQVHNMYEWYAGIAASIAVAYCLYYIAERPAIQYLQKLRKAKAPNPVRSTLPDTGKQTIITTQKPRVYETA